MSEQNTSDTQQAPPSAGDQISDGIGRVWSEIKLISKQFEQETRRTGRSARLKLDVRRLQKEQDEVLTRLGKAVHEAAQAGDHSMSLEAVEGFAGGIAALDSLGAKIAAKEAEIEALRDAEPTPAPATPETPADAEEVAGEPVSG